MVIADKESDARMIWPEVGLEESARTAVILVVPLIPVTSTTGRALLATRLIPPRC